jgi:hypothetical protein
MKRKLYSRRKRTTTKSILRLPDLGHAPFCSRPKSVKQSTLMWALAKFKWSKSFLDF